MAEVEQRKQKGAAAGGAAAKKGAAAAAAAGAGAGAGAGAAAPATLAPMFSHVVALCHRCVVLLRACAFPCGVTRMLLKLALKHWWQHSPVAEADALAAAAAGGGRAPPPMFASALHGLREMCRNCLAQKQWKDAALMVAMLREVFEVRSLTLAPLPCDCHAVGDHVVRRGYALSACHAARRSGATTPPGFHTSWRSGRVATSQWPETSWLRC